MVFPRSCPDLGQIAFQHEGSKTSQWSSLCHLIDKPAALEHMSDRFQKPLSILRPPWAYRNELDIKDVWGLQDHFHLSEELDIDSQPLSKAS